MWVQYAVYLYDEKNIVRRRRRSTIFFFIIQIYSILDELNQPILVILYTLLYFYLLHSINHLPSNVILEYKQNYATHPQLVVMQYHLGHFPINWKGANVQRSRLYYLTQTCRFQKVVQLDAPGVREGIDRRVGQTQNRFVSISIMCSSPWLQSDWM